MRGYEAEDQNGGVIWYSYNLSDDSRVHNVSYTDPATNRGVTFSCRDRDHARQTFEVMGCAVGIEIF